MLPAAPRAETCLVPCSPVGSRAQGRPQAGRVGAGGGAPCASENSGGAPRHGRLVAGIRTGASPGLRQRGSVGDGIACPLRCAAVMGLRSPSGGAGPREDPDSLGVPCGPIRWGFGLKGQMEGLPGGGGPLPVPVAGGTWVRTCSPPAALVLSRACQRAQPSGRGVPPSRAEKQVCRRRWRVVEGTSSE